MPLPNLGFPDPSVPVCLGPRMGYKSKEFRLLTICVWGWFIFMKWLTEGIWHQIQIPSWGYLMCQHSIWLAEDATSEQGPNGESTRSVSLGPFSFLSRPVMSFFSGEMFLSWENVCQHYEQHYCCNAIHPHEGTYLDMLMIPKFLSAALILLLTLNF